MAYRSVLRIQLPVTMQPRAKHPLQRIPTWVALSIGIIVGLFVSKMLTGVSAPLVLRPVHSFPVPTPLFSTLLFECIQEGRANTSRVHGVPPPRSSYHRHWLLYLAAPASRNHPLPYMLSTTIWADYLGVVARSQIISGIA